MTVVFTDGFTGALNAVVNGRVGSGGTWSCAGVGANDIAGLKINAANQAKVATSNGCLGRIETGSANHYAKANIWTLTTLAAVTVRAVDHLNFIGLRVAGSTRIELFKRIGGVETSLGTVTVATLVAPVLLQLSITGTAATTTVNGVVLTIAGGWPAIGDAIFTGLTKAGLWGKSTVDPLADDFEAGTVGAAAVSVGPANALSAARDRSAVVAVSFGIAPAGGRSAVRDRNAAVVWAGTLVPAGSRLVQRAGSAGLGAMFTLVPARGVQAQHAGSATLPVMLGIAPTRSRLMQRAGAAAVARFVTGFATVVGAEARAVPTPGEVRTMKVAKD